jgi:hypothetical protein
MYSNAETAVGNAGSVCVDPAPAVSCLTNISALMLSEIAECDADISGTDLLVDSTEILYVLTLLSLI